ncbi:MAG TPA: molecular chaperone TorD family protein, partial [bacterium]
MIDPKEMQSVAAGRAKTYAVLAALYSAPPVKELAALICAGSLAQEGDGALSAAANELTVCFRRAASHALLETDVVAEYTRLFVLPSGVIPNESFYADEHRRIGGHVTVQVQRYYQAAGAVLTGACLELP